LVLAAVVAGGCGSSSHRQPAPAKVASSFAAYLAKRVANEDHPATAAQVDALRRRLAVTCEKPQHGQYPCTVRRRDRPGPEQGCIAFVDHAGRVVSGRCRGGEGSAPVTRVGYVDCRTAGHVITVHDAAGDTVGRTEVSALGVGRKAPFVDLTEVRVAATPRQFCANFKTTAPPRRIGTRLLVIATNPRAADSENRSFEPIIAYIDTRLPQVQLFANSAISGQVGSSGEWTSLLITSADIGPQRAAFLRAPFVFRAIAEYNPRTPGRISEALSDQAPDGRGQADYP
jgi:hypothetical protein